MEAETNYQLFTTNPTFIGMVIAHKKCSTVDAIKHLSLVYKSAEDKFYGVKQTKTEPIKLEMLSEQKIVEPEVAKPDELNTSQTPCQECGGVIFLRTGTCHVCQTCGASQGCS